MLNVELVELKQLVSGDYVHHGTSIANTFKVKLTYSCRYRLLYCHDRYCVLYIVMVWIELMTR